MSRKSQPDAVLVKATEHLLYEAQMLYGTARLLTDIENGSKDDHQNIVIYNALLESFTVHARAMLDFLYNDKPYKDDVIADDFTAPGYWFLRRLPKSPLLDSFHTQMNKRVAHLTYYRLNVKPNETWDYLRIAYEIGLALARFRDIASPNCVSQAFLDYIEGIAPTYRTILAKLSVTKSDDDKMYRGGVSLLPHPLMTQEEYNKYWADILKDFDAEKN